MLKYVLLSFSFLICLFLPAQQLADHPYAYIIPVSLETAVDWTKNPYKYGSDDLAKLMVSYDSVPAHSIDSLELKPGIYFIFEVRGLQGSVSMVQKSNYGVVQTQNSHYLELKVIAPGGAPVSGAVVKYGQKQLTYDAENQVYRLKRYPGNKPVTVEINGEKIILEKNHENYYYYYSSDKPRLISHLFPYSRWQPKFNCFYLTNKPKYKPLDTLHYRIHIKRKNWNANYAKDIIVHLKDNYSYYYFDENNLFTDTLQCIRPGIYAGEIVVSEDWPIDRWYNLVFSTLGGKAIYSDYIELEDYALETYSYTLDVPENKIHNGDSIAISFRADNINNLSGPDCQATLSLTLNYYDVDKIFTVSQYFYDTVFHREYIIPVGEDFEVMLPASVIPDFFGDLRASVEFISPDGESETLQKYIQIEKIPGGAHLTDENDHLIIEAGSEGTCILVYGQTTDSIAIRKNTPYTLPVNGYLENIYFENEYAQQRIGYPELKSKLDLRIEKSGDSLIVTASNPRKLPFTLLYGYGKEKENVLHSTEAMVQIIISYKKYKYFHANLRAFFKGEENSLYDGYGTDKNALIVDWDIPNEVQPGKTVEVHVNASYGSGKPAVNIELAAMALNAKFEEGPGGKEFNTEKFRPSVYMYYPEFSYHYPYLDPPEFILTDALKNRFHALSYPVFQLMNPDSGYAIHKVPVVDSIPQYFVYLKSKGFYYIPNFLKNPNLEYVNYNYWGRSNITSIRTNEISPYASFCFDKKFYNMPDIPLEKGYKTIVCIDVDKAEQSKSYLKLGAFSRTLYTDIVNDNTFFWDPESYSSKKILGISDGLNVFPVTNYYGQNIGPFSPGEPLTVYFSERDSMEIPFENNSAYDFRYNFVRTDDPQWIRKRTIFRKTTWAPDVAELNSLAYKPHQLYKKRYTIPTVLHKEWNITNRLVIDDFTEAYKYRIETESEEKVYLIFRQDDPLNLYALKRYSYGTSVCFENLPAGNYGVMAINNNRIRLLTYVHIPDTGFTVVNDFGQHGDTSLAFNLRKDHNELNITHNGKPAFINSVIAGGDLDITLSITDSITGKPVPGARVELYAYSSRYKGHTANTSGKLEITAARDSQVVVISKPGYRPQLTRLPAGPVPGPFTIKLTPYPCSSYPENYDKNPELLHLFPLSSWAISKDSLKYYLEENTGIFIDGVSTGNFNHYLNGGFERYDNVSLEEVKISNVSGVADFAFYNWFGNRKMAEVSVTTGLSKEKSEAYSEAPSYERPPDLESFGYTETPNPWTIRKSFSDYGFWKPDLVTDEYGKATFSVTFPDDITVWDNYLYATGPKRKTVRLKTSSNSFLPLTATLTVPRFLIEGDTTYATGIVMNQTGKNLSVALNAGLNKKPVYDAADSVENASSSRWKIYAPANNDSLKLDFTASSGDLKDGEEWTIPVFPVGDEEAEGHYLMLDNDTTFTISLPPGTDEYTLYASKNLMSMIEPQMQYLMDYEYECNEQMASKLIALITDMTWKQKTLTNYSKRREIKKLIKRLEDNQLTDGGFSWWGKGNMSSYYISAHIAEAFLLLKENGYESDILSSLGLYISGYTLDKDRQRSLSALELYLRFYPQQVYFKDIDSLDPGNSNTYQKLLFLKSKALTGRTVSADSVLALADTTLLGLPIWGNHNASWYGNHWKATVLAYQTIRLIDSSHAALPQIVQSLFLNNRSALWLNTANTALILMTLSKDYREEFFEPSHVTINGDTLNGRIKMDADPQLTQTLEIKKSGSGPVYFSWFRKYWVKNPQPDTNGFIVKTSWVRGNNEFKIGESTQLKVEVENTGYGEFVMIEVPVPAGFTYDGKFQSWDETHREHYKNKVVIFIEALLKGKHTYIIPLVPKFLGKFTQNPARAELMYFPEKFGRESIKKVEIK